MTEKPIIVVGPTIPEEICTKIQESINTPILEFEIRREKPMDIFAPFIGMLGALSQGPFDSSIRESNPRPIPSGKRTKAQVQRKERNKRAKRARAANRKGRKG